MLEVLYTGIPDSAVNILTSRLSDYSVKSMGTAGVKQKVIKAKTSAVALLILGQSEYNMCKSVNKALEVLNMDKTHMYTSDSGLVEFLNERLGVEENTVVEESSVTMCTEPFAVSEDKFNAEESTVSHSLECTKTNAHSTESNEGISSDDYKKLEDELLKVTSEKNSLRMIINSLERRIHELTDDSDSAVSNESDKNIALLEQELLVQKEENSKLREQLAIGKSSTTLELEVSMLNSNLKSMKEQLISQESQCNDLRDKLIVSKSELHEERKEKIRLNATIASLERDLEESNKNNSILSKSVSDKNEENSSLSRLIEDLRSRNSVLDADLRDRNSTIDRLNNDLSVLVSEREAMQDNIEELSSACADLREDLGARESMIGELESKVSEYLGKISDLESSNSSLLGRVSSLERDLGEETNRGNALDIQLSEACNKVNVLETQLEVELGNAKQLRTTISDELSTNNELRNENSSLTSEVSMLTARVNELERLNNELNSKVNELSTENSNLESKLEKASNESRLKVIELENKVRQGESSYRNALGLLSDKDDEIALLREAIAKSDRMCDEYKKLYEISSENVSMDDFKAVTSSLDEYKSALSSYKAKASKLASMVKMLKNSIFYRLGNSAQPTSMSDVLLNIPSSLNSQYKLYVDGSGESKFTLYKHLYTLCESNPSTKYLILDLSSESYIDSCFGTRGNTSYIRWLFGDGSISDSLVDTNIPNTKVLYTGFSYVNEASYLKVDWVSKLKDIDRLGYTVIINVGGIDSSVRSIMFNSFTKLCSTSEIIVKGSPTCIRTLIVNLGSIDYKNVTSVLCYDYSKYAERYAKILNSKCPVDIKSKL